MDQMLSIFTITDANRIQTGELARMLSSISKSSFGLYLGVRNSPEFNLPKEVRGQILRLPEKISLSAARNMLLNRFISQLPDDSYVFFLDDDAYLDSNFEKQFSSLSNEFDFVVANIPEKSTGKESFKIPQTLKGVEFVLRNVSSNNLIIRKSNLEKFRFDENLGLGTELVAGEDLDLGMHLIVSQKSGIYLPSLISVHPQETSDKKYYFASVAVLLKYRFFHPGISILIIRRVISGLIRIMTRRIAKSNLRVLMISFKKFL